MTTAEQTLDGDRALGADTSVEVRRWLVVLLTGLLWCAALLIGWRRLAGALDTPLTPAVLLLLGVVVVAVAVGARSCWNRLPSRSGTLSYKRLARLLPTTAVLLLGAAVSLRQTNAAALIAFWAMLAGEELWAWRAAAGRKRCRGAENREAPRPPEPPPTAAVAEASVQEPVPATTPSAIPADDVLQQLTLSRVADGGTQLAGLLRPPSATGQRTAAEHVAFCPPFAKTPQVTVEQLDGPPARVKTAQLLPHGVRLDLKLDATADTPQAVLLQFTARSESDAQ